MSIKSAHTMSYNYLENMTLPDGEEIFGDFGVDEETSEKIYFICWDHNGVRYKKNSIIGITTPFNVVAVTGSKDDLIPDDPTPIVDPDQSTEPANKPDGKKKGSKTGMIVGIVIAVIVILAAAAIGIFFFIKKKAQRKDSSNGFSLIL